MFDIAEFLMTNNKPISFDNLTKYSLIENDFVVSNQPVTPAPQPIQKASVSKSEHPATKIPIKAQPKVEATTNIEETDVYKALKEYRLSTSKAKNIKPYFIYNNEEMESIIRTNTKTKAELLNCKGFGEKKFERYGNSILEILKNNQ